MKTLTLLLAFAVPATASPVTYGTSWDGPVPGTFADIAGPGSMLGHPDFQAGIWLVTQEAGHTAWAGQDVLSLEGDSYCAVAANGCPLGGPGTALQVYMDRPWHLAASTPSYTRQLSLGDQFAFLQTGPNTWRYGVEDILLPRGDADYQDLLGTLTYLGPGGLTPTPQTATPVDEPFTLVLIGGALTAAQLARRLRP